MRVTKETMPETMYRASRCCRVLGNPMAYLVVRWLGERRMTPSDIGRALDVPVSTVSTTLRHLRNLDMVRYVTRGTTKIYWVKDRQVLHMLATIEAWVETVRQKRL